jgi:hypothetical protein
VDAATVRIPAKVWAVLEPLLTWRYPRKEWATFFRFGWRVVGDHLLVSLAAIEPPGDGDLDETISIVGIQEPYTVRTVMQAERQPLAVGVIHSHPQGYGTVASPTDDDMDSYFGEYIGSFLPGRPYASLIYSKDEDGRREFSGRIWFEGKEYTVEKTIIVGDTVESHACGPGARSTIEFAGSAPTIAAYGEEATLKLQAAMVAIVGVGGTGSAVAHLLTRAGVGRLVLIDHDQFESRNLERLHGSKLEHISSRPRKVDLVRKMCLEINPALEVIAIDGNCLGRLAMDWLLRSDLVLGCTDTLHSRVALSEIAYRYLMPVIDMAVQLDGNDGVVTAEVMQFTRYHPGAPCAYCRGLVDSVQLAFELMPEGERAERKRAADEARRRGVKADMYWREQAQLLTVGHLTTAAAGIAAAYTVGLITGRFKPPATFYQCDILADGLGYGPVEIDPRPGCACSEVVGFADQGSHRAVISAPTHWPEPRVSATEVTP